MVLHAVHRGAPLPHRPSATRTPTRTAIRFDRSVAMAGVLGVHLAAALVLGLPQLTPDAVILSTEPAPPVSILAELVRAEPVPLPPPPMPLAPPRPQPRAVTAPVTITTPVFEQAAWSAPAVPATSAALHTDGATAHVATPDRAVPLAYADASAPPYPRDALRAGLEGRVLLRVQVAPDGRVLSVGIERGSGHRTLDQAAQRHVRRHWRFHPAVRDGAAVGAWALVPIHFSLSD